MSSIFYNRSSLNSLNLSNFNTNNSISMSHMFHNYNESCDIITNHQNLLKLIMDL